LSGDVWREGVLPVDGRFPRPPFLSAVARGDTPERFSSGSIRAPGGRHRGVRLRCRDDWGVSVHVRFPWRFVPGNSFQADPLRLPRRGSMAHRAVRRWVRSSIVRGGRRRVV